MRKEPPMIKLTQQEAAKFATFAEANPGVEEGLAAEELIIEELPAFDVALMQGCGDQEAPIK
jgi:hypothetical protein